jgi:putative Mg2+ transporter-C (MgtC) family protein
MQTVLTFETLASLVLSIILGAIVGVEREHAHRPAGLRTHMMVALGSCLFTVMSQSFGAQPAQVAGGIVAGIGFIGAGTIWAEKEKVHVQGITTAASLWATAAIGLAAGLGDYPVAIAVTIMIFLILASKYFFSKIGLEERYPPS